MQIEPERFDLIGELAAAYPSVAIAEQTIEVYVKDLSDVPLNVLRNAVEACRGESRFFPTVAEIREKITVFQRRNYDVPIDCSRCYGTGWEEYKENGYKQARKCNHVVEGFIGPPDPDADVDQW